MPTGIPLDAPFRPHRGRVVPLVMGAAAVLICLASALALGASGAWTLGDQVMLVAFGFLIAGFLWRYSAIKATPGPEGLTIRNLMLTSTVSWDDIAAVRFADGDPWVSLELTDTDVVSVMAIQRADGEIGRAEAARLAALAQHHRDLE